MRRLDGFVDDFVDLPVVRLGEVSDRTIVIEFGLAAGDLVIASETLRWEEVEALQLIE